MTTEALAQKEKQEHAVEFVPFGATDSIRLTAAMVRGFIAVPTRSGKLPTERDCIKFIMLCRGKRANPFEGDCYLIGYDSKDGPSFSMVCGQDLFMKRAEGSEDYDGCESGVIVMRENVMEEREGCLVLDNDTLVGGWAKVYRKNQSHPVYKTVKFDTYDTGRSRWLKDPGGMIEKVAKSQALRAAYPTALGGLYTQEEMERLTEAGEGKFLGSKEPVAMPTLTEAPTAQEAEAATEDAAATGPEGENVPADDGKAKAALVKKLMAAHKQTPTKFSLASQRFNVEAQILADGKALRKWLENTMDPEGLQEFVSLVGMDKDKLAELVDGDLPVD